MQSPWVAEAWSPQQPGPKPVVPDWLADVEPTAPPPPRAPADINVELVVLPGPLAPPPSAHPALRVGGFSSVGRVRERNEDRFFAQHWCWSDGSLTREGALLIVADGMGGHQGGERASATTVRVVSERLRLLPLQPLPGPEASSTALLLGALVHALVEANRVVLEEATAEQGLTGMGATVAVALVWDGRLFASHVGDCRVYLQRGNALMQRTTDQTLVARMVALGQLTPAEA
jgi:protein phosphatase